MNCTEAAALLAIATPTTKKRLKLMPAQTKAAASIKVKKSKANAASKFYMTLALARNKKRLYLTDTTGSNSAIETKEEGEKGADNNKT